MIRLIALLLAMVPALAAAQTVSVRGGEHGGFTRVVLDLPAETTWTLRPEDDGDAYTVILDGKTWPVDVTRSFDRIDRSRIASLEGGAGRLRLDLNCACSASAFLFGERMLVIDVAASVTTEGQRDRVETRFPPRARAISGADGLPPAHAATWPALPPLYWLESARPSPAVDSFTAEILAKIDRAVADGVLDPVAGEALGPFSLDRQKPLEPAGSSGARPVSQPRQLAFEEREGHLSIGGRRCIPDAELAIEEWSAADFAGDSIATSRADLVAEFDKVDKAAVTAHAQELLALGFGAEARAVLRNLGAGESPALIALSFLVDGELDGSGAFAGQTGCPGRAALWALLAGTGDEAGQSLNTNAVLRAFESLPDHLKSHLAPRIAERFDAMGDRNAARNVLRRTERALGEETDGLTLVSARLDAAEGDHSAAARRLAGLIAQPGPETPAALVAAVEVAAEENSPLPSEIVEMTAALAAERRHDADGPSLWLAHVRSLLLTGAFDTAFEAIADATQMPDTMRAMITEEAVTALARDATDPVFLKQALGSLGQTASARPEIGRAVAARLLDLGLAEPALDILGRFSAPGRDDRLLSARIWLELQKPEQAEIQLIGLQGPDADALRARARGEMGDHEYAARAYAELGEGEAASRARWLAGNWTDVAREGEGARSDAALLFSDEETAEAGPALSVAERLTEDASRTREVLRALLEETRITDD